jgi:Arc/MetJ-type ribon-helix-helix transcriptional regulator
MTMNRKSDKTVSVPIHDHNVIKTWVTSGKSPYVSTDEAYRDAVRNILYGRWQTLNNNKKSKK